jgi:hypothetical protein
MKFHSLHHFSTLGSDFHIIHFLGEMSWIFWILRSHMLNSDFCCWTCIFDEISLIASSLKYGVRFPQNQLFEWNELNFLNYDVSYASTHRFLAMQYWWCNFTYCIIFSVLGQICTESYLWVKWAEFFEFRGLRCW